MDKRIGKFLALFLAVCSTSINASLSLVAKDMYGQLRRKIALGTPFVIEVQVTDGPDEEPELGLPQEIHVIDRSISTSYRSVNGKTSGSRTYTYRARVDKEGSFIVGPARMRSDTTLQSNTLTLQIEKNSDEQPLKRPFFVELSVKPEKIYVGQEAIFYIRFYYATDNVALEQLEDPSFNDCYATKVKGPITGVQTKDSVDYKYLEWQATICPKKVGQLVIPALAANIAIKSNGNRSSNDMFNLMNMFFGAGRTERHYSNALSCDVWPLPDHNQDVNGVGSFSSYTAKVNLKEASVGEGVVYTLELVGTGNTQAMIHPVLELPDQIKYYDSHAKEKLLSDVIKKKDFEYILQALAPGTYTIPVQKFTFFDPHARRYKTLTTAPVALVIHGQSLPQKNEEHEHCPEEVAEEEIEDELDDQERLSPLYKASWRAGMPRSIIPWMWYLVMLLLLVGIAALGKLYILYRSYRAKHQRYYTSKHAFVVARKELDRVLLKQDYTIMYTIFKKLYAHKLHVAPSLISQEYIDQVLQERHMSDDERAQWNRFFDEITQIHFGLAESADIKIKKEAQVWLNRLEKVLS